MIRKFAKPNLSNGNVQRRRAVTLPSVKMHPILLDGSYISYYVSSLYVSLKFPIALTRMIKIHQKIQAAKRLDFSTL